MKFFYSFIIASCLFFTLLGIWSSCKQSIALEFPNSTIFDVSTAYTESVTVSARIFQAERLEQPGTRIVAGYHIDPIFGKTKVSTLINFGKPSDTFEGTDLVVDSAVLVLKNTTEFVGDTLTSKHHFRVRKIDEKITSQNEYKSDYDFQVANDIFGSLYKTEISLTKDIEIEGFTSSTEHELETVTSEMRIRLDEQKVLDFFVEAPSYVYRNSSTFREYFDGFYLDVDETVTEGEGGIFFFDPSGSKLEIYYHAQTGADTLSTTYVSFAVASSAGRIVSKFDRQGTEIETQLAESGTIFDELYLQALSGTDLEITIDNYDFLQGDIAIHKAELILYPVNKTGAQTITVPSILTIYDDDLALQRGIIVDQSSVDVDVRGFSQLYGGSYDSEEQSYTFIITSYLEDLINGENNYDNKFYVTVTAAADVSIWLYSSFNTAKGVVLSQKGDQAMKVVVYYSELNP